MLRWSSRVRLAAARTRDQRKRICIRDEINIPNIMHHTWPLQSIWERFEIVCVLPNNLNNHKRTNQPKSVNQPVKQLNQPTSKNDRKSRVVTRRHQSQPVEGGATKQAKKHPRGWRCVGRPVAKHAPQSSAAGSISNRETNRRYLRLSRVQRMHMRCTRRTYRHTSIR